MIARKTLPVREDLLVSTTEADKKKIARAALWGLGGLCQSDDCTAISHPGATILVTTPSRSAALRKVRSAFGDSA
jgi:hypothetical protein